MDKRHDMDPLEALDYACVSGGVCSGGWTKPGYIIERMPRDVREALERLTSDEAMKQRPRYLGK